MNELKLYYWTGKSNFGDQLSKVVVEWISKRKVKLVNRSQSKKLLAIGSILYAACDGDVIWGTGVHPIVQQPYTAIRFFKKRFPENLDVRAVRGPITRDFLLSQGIRCPEVYGDPALLLPLVYPSRPNPEKEFGIVPHYSDQAFFKRHEIIDVSKPWKEVVNEILKCKKIISSSLHGIIVAESYGIPAVWLRISNNEGILKYLDYYLGTNRFIKPAYDLRSAIKNKIRPPPKFKIDLLVKSFPGELMASKNFNSIFKTPNDQ